MYSREDIKKKFENFVASYNTEEYVVRHKREHSLKVADVCIDIAKSLNLSINEFVEEAI